MPGHPLIEAYLAGLRRALPAEAADELADGLLETYDALRARGLEPAEAARAARAEFGAIEEVVAAFAQITPGRRAGRGLLASGPLLGGCWAVALAAGHAWAWPIPFAARLAFAALLLAVVAMLAAAARASYLRPRRSAALAGTSGLMLADATAIIAVPALAPALAWPLLLAIAASLARICCTIPAFRAVLSTR